MKYIFADAVELALSMARWEPGRYQDVDKLTAELWAEMMAENNACC